MYKAKYLLETDHEAPRSNLEYAYPAHKLNHQPSTINHQPGVKTLKLILQRTRLSQLIPFS